MNKKLLDNIYLLMKDGLFFIRQNTDVLTITQKRTFYSRLEQYIEFHNNLSRIVIKTYAGQQALEPHLQIFPVLQFEDYSASRTASSGFTRLMTASAADKKIEMEYLTKLRHHLTNSLDAYRNIVELETKDTRH